jgi:hypothetical protein
MVRFNSSQAEIFSSRSSNFCNGFVWLAAFREENNQLVAHDLKIDRGSNQFDLGKHGQVFHQRLEQFL